QLAADCLYDMADLVGGVGDHKLTLAESLDDQALEPGEHRLALVLLDAEVHPMVGCGVRPEPDEMAVRVDDVRPAVPGTGVRRVEEDVPGVGPEAGSPHGDVRRGDIGAGPEGRTGRVNRCLDCLRCLRWLRGCRRVRLVETDH